MNETMEKLLAAARQGAAQAGDLAVNTAHGLKKKAGETLSAAKQRLRIAALEGEIEGTLAEIGELLYATHTGTPTDSEVLQEKLRKIDALKTEIAVLKGGPDRPVVCAVCGTQSRPGDVFCRFCGGKL